jgi:hypothetical protein
MRSVNRNTIFYSTIIWIYRLPRNTATNCLWQKRFIGVWLHIYGVTNTYKIRKDVFGADTGCRWIANKLTFLQAVCLHISFPCKFRIQILKKELNPYNKSQEDALFLNFILVKNSTCFGQIYCPSSRVLMLYSINRYLSY